MNECRDIPDAVFEELRLREFASGFFKCHREQMGWTQKQLADHLRVSQQLVSSIECMNVYLVPKESIQKLISTLKEEKFTDTMEALKE